MAIDSSLFAADVPAGSYNVGDIIPLRCIDGPQNVRSGRGAAVLKRILSGVMNFSGLYYKFHIKNSNWIDEVVNLGATVAGSPTVFDDESGCSQTGHDANLVENSAWEVYAEIIIGGTTSSPSSIFALIDVDYPSVGGVAEPTTLNGVPVSIPYTVNAPAILYGSAMSSTWSVVNVDYFKAGYEYALDAVESILSSPTSLCFIAFSGAAGMGGLTRIVPLQASAESIRFPVRYSSKLVKGPMEIKLKAFDNATGIITAHTVHDYVRRA